MVFWFIIAIIIGMMPTTILPEIITIANDGMVYNNITGMCDATPPDLNDPEWFISKATPSPTLSSSTGICSDSTYRGQSKGEVYPDLVDEFKRLVLSDDGYGLITKARAQAGNIAYEVILNNNTFIWEEEWESFAAVAAWVTQGPPATIFNDPNNKIVNNMFVNGKLDVITQLSGAIGEEPCYGSNNNLTAAFVFDVTGLLSCQSLWNDLIDANSCAWIKDCVSVANVNTNPTTGFVTRDIVLSDGSTYPQVITLTAEANTNTQWFFDYQNTPSLTSSIILEEAQINGATNISTCNIYWEFDALSSYADSLVTFYQELNTNNIEYIESLYP